MLDVHLPVSSEQCEASVPLRVNRSIEQRQRCKWLPKPALCDLIIIDCPCSGGYAFLLSIPYRLDCCQEDTEPIGQARCNSSKQYRVEVTDKSVSLFHLSKELKSLIAIKLKFRTEPNPLGGGLPP